MENPELIHYLTNNKVTPKRLTNETQDEMHRPIPNRTLFVTLRSYTRNFLSRGAQPRMVAISGLRGVGKTTLMWQTADAVYKSGMTNIYYLSVDDLNRLGSTLYEAFAALETHVLKCPLTELDHPIMFLIDEVHEAPEWDKDLKILYERCKRAFILCTGSSALLLHKSPDLASRWTLEKLYPFRFSEFILAKSWADDPKRLLFPIKDAAANLRNVLYYSENIDDLMLGLQRHERQIGKYLSDIQQRFPKVVMQELLDEFISYHNIARFLRIENKGNILDRVIDLFERIIQKDLPQYRSNEDSARVQRMLQRLALSDEVNFQKLAKEFRCRESEIEQLIDALDKAEILNVFYPDGGIKAMTGQNRKAFFMSPSLRRALYSRLYGPTMSEDLRAKLYEDITAMYLRKSIDGGLLGFGQQQGSSTPDFIVRTRDKAVLIEVGTHKTSMKQVEQTKDKRYGIVLSARATQVERYGNSVKLPFSWFLLT